MGGRIVEFARAVAGACHDLAIADDDGADRHLATRGGGLGFAEGHRHEVRPRGLGLILRHFTRRAENALIVTRAERQRPQ
jgi:hypothetical protein